MNRRAAAAGLAAGLALLTAAIHLQWGIPRFVAYASVGVMPDPRPPLFVASGHAILVALSLAALGVIDRRRLHLPGAALMAAHLLGYAAWHTVLAHGVAAGAAPHRHVTVWNAGPIVLEHLLASPIVLVSKLTELAALCLLVWLALADSREVEP